MRSQITLRACLIFIVAGLLFAPAGIEAQSSSEIETFEVALWPEYDRMGVLTIYKVRLPSEVSLPARVRVPIPASVGGPHAVAAWSEDGSLNDDVSWTQEGEGDWSYITVESSTNGIWLEYYDELKINGDERRHSFKWPGGWSIDKFTFEVLKPVGARDLQVNSVGTQTNGPEGRPFIVGELGSIEVEDELTIELSYTKPSSVELVPLSNSQNITFFQQLHVDLLPEFDVPAMLLIYQGLLSEAMTLPTRVQLPFPASFGEPSAVAVRDSTGSLYSAEYESELDGDWRIISFETNLPAVWVEVYADLFIDGNQRSFSLQWPEGVEIGSFDYQVQQPFGATGMRVSPTGSVEVGEDGMAYYSAEIGPVSGDMSTMVSVEYEKSDSALTQPSLERPAETQGGTPDPLQWLPYLIGLVGIILVVAGVIFFLRSRKGRSKEAAPPRKRKRQRKSQTDQPREMEASPVYCHICGTKSAASDRFCRQCGTQLRK